MTRWCRTLRAQHVPRMCWPPTLRNDSPRSTTATRAGVDARWDRKKSLEHSRRSFQSILASVPASRAAASTNRAAIVINRCDTSLA